MLHALLVLTVLATSTLSGILGMAGGMILMAILASTLSVAAAMLLHGAVQLTSNGSRAWFLRRHVRWAILPWYALGAAVVLAAFAWLLLVPPPGIVLILVGGLSLLGRLLGKSAGLDVSKPATAVACGGVVTAAQLLAGASGPLLDVFYLHSPLSRHEVVASKAITQALGHVLKIVYYGGIVGVSGNLPPVFVGLCIAAALVGTRLGTWLLDRLDDSVFRRWSGYVITGIAVWCVLQGLYLLMM